MKPTSKPSQAAALDVFYGAARVGTVHDGAPLGFEYAPSWLARPDAFALPSAPLGPGRVGSSAVQAFFENLLPEGDLRAHLAEQRKASTLFSLLREVAGDTAGAFVLLPQGQTPVAPAYEPTTWAALAGIIRGAGAAAIQARGKGARISLAGAQDKASIAIFDGRTPVLPLGAAPSTHILKPDIRRLPKVWESAANEAIIMRTAALCGLNTPAVFYESATQACVVERFDRFLRPDGTLGRLVQYDFCQLSGTGSERKYEKEGGPGIARCVQIVRQYSAGAAADLQALVQWLFFNLYTGNNDSHGKNLSLYWRPGEGVRLTPFYDLMCTRIYPGLSREFAFNLGGTVLPGEVGGAQVRALAGQVGMGARYLQSTALALAERVPGAVEQAALELAPGFSRGGQTFAEKLVFEVRAITRRTAARIARL